MLHLSQLGQIVQVQIAALTNMVINLVLNPSATLHIVMI